MGSSLSTSTAMDNRQAVTDKALAVSTSGHNNNMALSGHIINFGSSQGSIAQNGGKIGGETGGGKSDGGGGSGGGTVNILDAGAIDKAFDFAAFSLSETLGSIINSNKQTATQLANAQQYSMETIGSAINSAATTTSQAAQQAATENGTTLKRIALISAAAAGAWYLLFKGKK